MPTISAIAWLITRSIKDTIDLCVYHAHAHQVNDCVCACVTQVDDGTTDHEWGAPIKLISDHAQVEISQRVKSILLTPFIGEWQIEPHQQQQNAAERRYQTVKARANEPHYQAVKAQANAILDRTSAPEYTWLLAFQYTCFLLNHCCDWSIGAILLSPACWANNRYKDNAMFKLLSEGLLLTH
jgi:hypothetical protein